MKKSAELKSKRIRHCYPRQELYHRFIHDDKMMYYESTYRCSCSCIGNVFFAGTAGRWATIDYLKNNNYYLQEHAVAVIDRKYKRILISTRNTYHWYQIRNAVPDDFEIFYTNNVIPSYDILRRNKRDLLYKIHAEYLMKQFCNCIIPAYAVLQNKVKTTCFDYKRIFSTDNKVYANIIDFIHNHKLNNRKWYKKPLFPNFEEYMYSSWSKRINIKFETPSLQSLVRGTVFTQEERIKIEQTKFYSEYCYGYGIPFKDVVNNWNKTNWDRKLINKYNRTNIVWDSERYPTFNEFIQQTTIIVNEHRNKQIQEWQKQAEENYTKALQELAKLNGSENTVNDWREGTNYYNGSFRIKYKNYISPKRKNDMGYWTDSYVSNNGRISFDNTQLRLKGNIIETSRGARVPLDKAIILFKIMNKYIKANINVETPEILSFKDTYIGCYNVRYLQYRYKIKDNGVLVGNKEWLITIGCHHLWFDDILDFIHYYKLEKEFGI